LNFTFFRKEKLFQCFIFEPLSNQIKSAITSVLSWRQLRPWSGNVGKRLVKAPNVYIRDSGIAHALLNLKTMDDVLGHPIVGASWEGFILENLISSLPVGVTPWFYRTSAGAEKTINIFKNP
jgi:predicted AAA+ superfamily ATPase